VAATELTPISASSASPAGWVLAAALALPGVIATPTAHAENAPEHGLIGFKMLSYQDRQPGLKRVGVTAPSVSIMAPLGSQWSIDGSAVLDSVSGASPRYHSAISGASRMSDERRAADLKVTRYEARSAYSLGVSSSTEHDYRSRALSADARFASADNNTTWNIGLGLANDRITQTGNPSLNERKRTRELMVGVTQAVSANDLVQINLTASFGKGFYSDPYKELDVRPGSRRAFIGLARWNHYFEASDTTLRSSYRYYHDSFGIHAHTLDTEWVKRLTPQLTLTPSARYSAQSAARFYFDPVYGVDANGDTIFPPGYDPNSPPTYSSLDQRLSAFGAITLGLKATYAVTPLWTADAKLELYEQRAAWRLLGGGSPGIAPFSATFVQLGVSRRF
jgi:hypothetical protein